ncbi:MAG: DNA topoisomerase I [Pseudoxanthomonas sp.]|nr:DNA topoisomerase I [Pseudoxanthomonas sp.]
MAKNLLIVESPAKAKTINKYLGKDFEVLASYGHIRDLLAKEGAVDPEHGFAMRYEVDEDSRKRVDAIAKAAGKAKALYLATDLDREGESISWHILEVLRERGLLEGRDIHRVVFSEITPKAILEAVAHPRQVSMDLVNAQQARRALDHLVGFTLSPLLWRKVGPRLSAGRVQSPALRMIVEREEEIEAFVAREYWTVAANLSQAGVAFQARLVRLDGRKFEQFDLVEGAGAEAARSRLEAAAAAQGRPADGVGMLRVTEVNRKQRQRRPAPPFITSTLQQEAARKLGYATSRTMRLAQQLYEGIAIGAEGVQGLITYMRTDSTSLSGDALGELREVIARQYGADLLPPAAQVYRTKSKNAQEAHEAIRPTSAARRPESVRAFLSDEQFRLYELIWKRTVACQMKPALLDTVAVELACGPDSGFRATGTTIADPGFLTVYEEGKDSRSQDDDDEGRRLPALREGELVPCHAIVADQHFTEPPPRFSEASLVKALEEYGIGRPSTYASIIQTLLSREYVYLDSRRFRPTDVGRAVAKFLAGHFDTYVDYEFTARLEDELDAISRGEEDWVPLLERFWQPFKARVAEKAETVDRAEATGARVLGSDPASGRQVSVRLGRYGPFAQIGQRDEEEPPKFASLRSGQSIHTIDLEQALALFRLPRSLGNDPDGNEITVGIGRFGPFVKRGTTYASLRKEDDPHEIDLARGLELLKLKEEAIANRVIASFEDGAVQILRGRFGPFATDGSVLASLPKNAEPESFTLEQARALLAEKGKPVKKRGAARKAPAGRKAAARGAGTTAAGAPRKAAKKAVGKAAKKAPAKAAKKVAKKAAKKAVKKAVGKTPAGAGKSPAARAGKKAAAKKAAPGATATDAG